MNEYVRFGKEMIHVTEAVSILQCSGETEDFIFRWLERRLQIGRFAK
jgi:hypothetical protein